MSHERVAGWDKAGLYVTNQLADLKADMREERAENREKFKSIFDKIEEMTASIASQETKTKILLAMTTAVGGGVISMAIQGLFQ